MRVRMRLKLYSSIRANHAEIFFEREVHRLFQRHRSFRDCCQLGCLPIARKTPGRQTVRCAHQSQISVVEAVALAPAWIEAPVGKIRGPIRVWIDTGGDGKTLGVGCTYLSQRFLPLEGGAR